MKYLLINLSPMFTQQRRTLIDDWQSRYRIN